MDEKHAVDVESGKPKPLPHFKQVFDQGAVTSAVLDWHYDGSGTEEDPFIVTWIDHDPRNPMLYASYKKWLLVLLVAFATLAVAFVSSAYSGGVNEIIEQFGASEEVAVLGISLFVLGFAIGPLLWAPLSELFGRQYLFISTYAMLTIFNAAAAGSQNIWTLIILRFFAGAFGSSPLTNAGGVIADMFNASQRGVAMVLFASAPFMGPVIGPIVGGYVGESIGWRWNQGIMAIFTGGLWITGWVLLPETYGPVLLRQRARRMTKLTGKIYMSKADAEQGKTTIGHAFATALSRPWILLLREPIVLLLSIYMAIIYGTLYMMFAAFPIVYQEGRGWSQGIGGLAFIGVAIGMAGAMFYALWDNKRYVRVVDSSPGGFAPPEARLPPTMVGAVAVPIGLFWFALGIHWASSIPAFLALACVPFPFIFYKYGPAIRQRCKFAAEADAFLQKMRSNTVADRPADTASSSDESPTEKEARGELAVEEEEEKEQEAFDYSYDDETKRHSLQETGGRFERIKTGGTGVGLKSQSSRDYENNPFDLDRVNTADSFSIKSILLFPTTDFLVSHKERETQAAYSELASSEEILACHVVRIPPGSSSNGTSKETPSLRDTRGKARQLTTINGKTVVVKDTFVYSNKGFKHLNQAQLLQDALYFPDVPNAQQWLIYYISRPLVGTPELLSVAPGFSSHSTLNGPTDGQMEQQSAMQPDQKEVKSFNDILNGFPLIARHMNTGFEKLFKQFNLAAERSFVDAPYTSYRDSATSTRSRHRRGRGSTSSSVSSLTGSTISKSSMEPAEAPQNQLRRALDILVMGAIELFQSIDKHQLSYLGSATGLSGDAVERMLETYIDEYFHDRVLFPRVCDLMKEDDLELDADLKHMTDVDLSQVGISLEDDADSRAELSKRLRNGVNAFKRMTNTSSPQEMVDVLLRAERCITSPADSEAKPDKLSQSGDEKKNNNNLVTANADLLVSMLLIVVIRSGVRNLHSRLTYMRDFLFVTNVETGEIGYALSTFEAVLVYLTRNGRGLRRISRANRTLWQAAKQGDLSSLKIIMEPSDDHTVGDASSEADDGAVDHDMLLQETLGSGDLENESRLNGHVVTPAHVSDPQSDSQAMSTEPDQLAHVFPWQTQQSSATAAATKPPLKKRVSMEARSISSSSGQSVLSQMSTLNSITSMSGETSVAQLSQTRDAGGNSALMMTVGKGQLEALLYLLSLEDTFQAKQLLADKNDEGTTLFSAAVQSGKGALATALLNSLQAKLVDDESQKRYFAQQDSTGRCVAHYLFHSPQLISPLANLLPWDLKDRTGQTPLFALCRSYDHEDYRHMVDSALSAAFEARTDEGLLYLDDHTDQKGNTLLHILNDFRIVRRILQTCDADPNASNDRRFTPIMIASKFARLEAVRVLYGDSRTDLQARDLRGLTATELAKDDEVRNRIDDMVLLSAQTASDGRITTIVRSFFVEDGTIRLIIKSGLPNSNSTITVTTCRRSLIDFENLAQWLALENPASWLPPIFNLRSPFQIPSKPSRAVLRDIQLRLDGFLNALLTHATFSTHEMVWEFFLVPDIDPNMLAERAKMKAEARVDKLREEYDPLINTAEVELFVGHAQCQVSAVQAAYRAVFRNVNNLRNVANDLAEAQQLNSKHISGLSFIPVICQSAFKRHSEVVTEKEFSPLTQLHYGITATLSNTTALLQTLSRPASLVGSITASQEQVTKHTGAASRSQRWPSALGLLDDTRSRLLHESLEKANKSRGELRTLGCELRYTQQTVANELAGWQAGHSGRVKDQLKTLAQKMVITEKARLDCMIRNLRQIERDKSHDVM
ncbi:MAG: hypothetical protein M1828_002833 [Chrysothrix sp. TS-e1954]|nr:MAG: hypothetical protein M1828_002833 [Chrysothrix sp. TS-e1954]